MKLELTFDLLPAAGVLLSLAAWYIPKFKTWFNSLQPDEKQLLMALILFVAAGGAAILSYFGIVDVYSGATWQEWVWYPLVDFVVALIANAGFYKATNKILAPKAK